MYVNLHDITDHGLYCEVKSVFFVFAFFVFVRSFVFLFCVFFCACLIVCVL